MSKLTGLTGVHLSLDEFTGLVNDLLPDYLPDDRDGKKGRSHDEVNPRLIRHYTSQRLLDEPLKESREARYTYRHLLQLLVLRRLMAEGYPSEVAGDLTRRSNDELTVILEGGAQLEVTPAQPAPGNPALDYLQSVRQRQGSEQPVVSAAPALIALRRSPSSAPTEPAPARWSRLEIAAGLELHVREDYRSPRTPHERQTLLERIEAQLQALKRR